MAIKSRKKGNQPKVFIGIFNDAGGFIISVDVWGRPHIKPVPPRQPYVERMAVVSSLLAQSKKVGSRGTRKQLQGLAEQIVRESLPFIQSRVR